MDADKQRACEAMLCLSTDDPPKECAPSLETFFAIQFSKPWKTFKARKNFLELCPSEDFDGKAAHIDVLAEGAGVCKMDNLLASLNVSEPLILGSYPRNVVAWSIMSIRQALPCPCARSGVQMNT